MNSLIWVEAMWLSSVTMRDRRAHFFSGGKEIIHKGFEDPAAFRGGKDDSKGRVQGVLLYLTGVA